MSGCGKRWLSPHLLESEKRSTQSDSQVRVDVMSIPPSLRLWNSTVTESSPVALSVYLYVVPTGWGAGTGVVVGTVLKFGGYMIVGFSNSGSCSNLNLCSVFLHAGGTLMRLMDSTRLLAHIYWKRCTYWYGNGNWHLSPSIICHYFNLLRVQLTPIGGWFQNRINQTEGGRSLFL